MADAGPAALPDGPLLPHLDVTWWTRRTCPACRSPSGTVRAPPTLSGRCAACWRAGASPRWTSPAPGGRSRTPPRAPACSPS
ncbi:hypothetical protein ACFQHO_28285 [Actinomadura yumaensis]|uniref:hypothetical protein n=1 Tax=Actinomadura yumaensis TaxID=111807 RepID=UPI003614FAE4